MMQLKMLVSALVLACLGSAALAGPVNVNTADARTLAKELEGIGLSKAGAIVAYRSEHGPFSTIAELAQVKGIGARTLEMNRRNIRFEDRP